MVIPPSPGCHSQPGETFIWEEGVSATEMGAGCGKGARGSSWEAGLRRQAHKKGEKE